MSFVGEAENGGEGAALLTVSSSCRFPLPPPLSLWRTQHLYCLRSPAACDFSLDCLSVSHFISYAKKETLQ